MAVGNEELGKQLRGYAEAGDLDAVRRLLDAGAVLPMVLINDIIVDSKLRNGDAMAALLIDSHPGQKIFIKADYSIEDWVELNNMRETAAALERKGYDFSLARRRAELHRQLAIFDSPLVEEKAELPGNFGYDVYLSEWEKYRQNIAGADVDPGKLKQITNALRGPASPDEVSIAPAEGERQILDLGYQGHVFNGALTRKNGKIMLYIYDRGDSILEESSSQAKGKKHVVKEIEEGQFAQVMSNLGKMAGLPKDQARSLYLNMPGLKDSNDPDVDSLSMKGFKSSYCASLGRKTNVRMLCRLEFGAEEGDRIYKEFSKGTRYLQSAALKKKFPTREDFISHYKDLPGYQNGKEQIDEVDLGKFYDKVQTVSSKIEAAPKIGAFRAGYEKMSAAAKVLQRSIRNFAGKKQGAEESSKDQDDERRKKAFKEIEDLGVIESFKSPGPTSKIVQNRAPSADIYDGSKATKAKVEHFFRDVEKIANGGKVTLASRTVLKHLLEQVGDADSLVINAKDGTQVKIQRDTLEGLQLAFEKDIFQQNFEQAKRIKEHGARNRFEAENFASIILDDGNNKVSDEEISKRIVKKHGLDEAVVSDSLPTSKVNLCRKFLDDIAPIKQAEQGISR